jgi:hypothetical protein
VNVYSSSVFPKTIERVYDLFQMLVLEMEINTRRADITVTEKLLNGKEIDAVF